MLLPEPLQTAIEELNKFPGIGRKTAQRLALHILQQESDAVARLVEAIEGLKQKLRPCSVCYNIASSDICDICASTKRDRSVICVVEDASDIFAIERSNEYGGLYHVLGGVLSPLSGINPDNLKIKELLVRLRESEIAEIILALNPNTEGETTALYLHKLLKPLNLKITRIARGVPIGGNLEFSDEATIGRAVLGRVEYS